MTGLSGKYGIFIAGTDTGAGKTVVTGLIARGLGLRGYDVCTQKWVETGNASGVSNEISRHYNYMKTEKKQIIDIEKYICPYVFRFPGSPHLAARLENGEVSVEKVKKAYRVLAKKYQVVLVEGAGGLFSPVTAKNTAADICKMLDLPIILVVDNKLGAINQALLNVEAIMSKKLKLIGMVFNQTQKNENKIILKDNPECVSRFSGVKILASIPYARTDIKLFKYAVALAKTVEGQYRRRDF